jgi:hypothetical protein
VKVMQKSRCSRYCPQHDETAALCAHSRSTTAVLSALACRAHLSTAHRNADLGAAGRWPGSLGPKSQVSSQARTKSARKHEEAGTGLLVGLDGHLHDGGAADAKTSS